MVKIDISIRKIRDPSCFWGIDTDESDESKFNVLQKEITNYYSDEQLFKTVLSHPSNGMKCVVRSDTKSWHRGRIEAVMVTHQGYKIRCFLVDKVTSVLVPLNRVFVSPAWVWEVPTRGIKFALYGIAPISLQTDYLKDEVHSGVIGKWDASAVEYFSQIVKSNNGHAHAEIVNVDDDGFHLARIYLEDLTTKMQICLNDVFVDKKFAVIKHIDFSIKESERSNSFCVSKDKFTDEEVDQQNQHMSALIEKEFELLEEIVKDDDDKCSDSSSAVNASDVLQSSRLSKSVPRFQNLNISNISFDAEHASSGTNSPKPSHTAVEPRFFSENEGNLEVQESSFQYSNASGDASASATSLDKKGRKSSIGRGKLLLDVVRSCSDSSSASSCASPPNVQRKIIGILSELKSPSKSIENSSLTKGSALSTDVGMIPQIPNASPEKCRNGDEIAPPPELTGLPAGFLDKLYKIISLSTLMSPTSNEIHPGNMSAGNKKILLLEKMLKEAKDEESGLMSEALSCGSIGRGKSLSSSQSLINKSTSIDQSTCRENSKSLNHPIEARIKKQENPIKKSEKKTTNNKEEAFFISKTTVVQNTRHTGTILVRGINPPNPISLFCDAPFPSFIIDTMQNLKYRGPYLIQGHVWSAIRENRNVLALAPSGGGKTLAYVAPLVSMLHGRNDTALDHDVLKPAQASFVKSRSPLMLVLCSSWKNVQNTVDYFNVFLNASPENRSAGKRHRVVGVSGGPAAEEAQFVNLITGCSILVCSPHSLLRILASKFIDLTRLEQLVLDDIHILVEEFTVQVREIMRLWTETLDDPDRPPLLNSKPRILSFGVQWTAGVECFVESFMQKSLLYISHPLEAAVYGEVQQQVNIVSNDFKLEYVRGLLRFINKETLHGGAAIFVRSTETMVAIAKSLKSVSVFCVEAHAGMPDVELQEIQSTFCNDATQGIIHIFTDDLLPILDIDAVQVAIHYELPRDDYQFGLRLSTMRSFYRIKKDANREQVTPRSYILVTEDNKAASIRLVKFLSRLSQPISAQMHQLASDSVESFEYCKLKKPLCPYLQAYGKCRDVKACAHRHHLSVKLDSPNSDPTYAKVPLSGHVRLYVLSVESATHFYARLLKRRTSDNKIHTYPNRFELLSKQLDDHYRCEQNWKTMVASDLKCDKLVAVRLSNHIYRARTVLTPASRFGKTTAVCWKTPGGVTKTRLQFVDTGAFHIVNIDTIAMLPRKFADVPYQAIEVRACNVQPIDCDTEWVFKANELVHCTIYGKEIEGNVVLALGHTVWLQPIVIRSKLPITGTVVTEANVVDELLQSGLAEKNSTHINNLLLGCREKGILCDVTSVKDSGEPVDSTDDVSLLRDVTNSPNYKNNLPDSPLPSVSPVPSTTIVNKCEKLGNLIANPTKQRNDVVPVSTTTNDTLNEHNELPVIATILHKSVDEISHLQNEDMPILKTSICDEEDDSSESEFSLGGSHSAERDQDTPKQKMSDDLNKSVNSTSSCLGGNSTANHKPTETVFQNGHAGNGEDVCMPKPRNEMATLSPQNSENGTVYSLSAQSSPNSSRLSALLASLNLLSVKKSPSVLHESTPTNSVTPKTSLVVTPTSETVDVNWAGEEVMDFAAIPHDVAITNNEAQENDVTPKHIIKVSEDDGVIPGKVKAKIQQSTNNEDHREEKPPRRDMANDSLLYPCCVKLMYCDEPAQRIAICEGIYITCRECHADVTERDIISLNKALMCSCNDRELTLISGSFLALINVCVPVKDYISLPDFVRKCCIGEHEVLYTLPRSVLAICCGLLDDVIENYADEAIELAHVIVTYLDQITLDSKLDQARILPVILNSLRALNKILNSSNEALVRAKESDLIDILTRIKAHKLTDELRKSLFIKLLSCESIDDYDSESTVSVDKELKPASKLQRKVYDPLNYDRFNNIDTDTDTGSSYRPYTPVYAQYDADTDCCTSDTGDTDVECLPGI